MTQIRCSIPVYDPTKALGAVHLDISPIDRTFSFDRLGEGPLRTYMEYTLCESVTEVLKRTWNTWVEPKKDNRIFYATEKISYPDHTSQPQLECNIEVYENIQVGDVLYVKDIEWSFPVDGVVTETVTLVAHSKYRGDNAKI